ncbi:Aldo/keto reductase subgroup family and NADP-dependent oxidoreductase domain-containing protein [Strongyloides ratti]|uniref:Aldo/keto reductase subgroup family and NADP-dependent oxidoreductase domain-containing protein n=1 Tax=Strongyloides ratti TaxID=34506 RepID=A0A090KR33_STRRB|nr:Aldo/keto reductase subgroup family and NADP-dependent oxidoreductase domain-containing protein [Strongyloides ratti]CEF59984.1 Aldo/keto reductase subgroup family and NADP-dependent oxidoreductase domain-containing protein [Strongyloides ratti]
MVISDNIIGGVHILNNGVKMPYVGLGTYKIVGQDAIDIAVKSALAAGYRMFDTAKYYHNEKELGLAFEKYLPEFNLKREDIFITTKFWLSESDNYTETQKHVQKSLELFKTNYLDLVLIHYPKADECSNDDPRNSQNRKDAYLALTEIYNSGVIKAIGVSNFEVFHIEDLLTDAKVMPAVNQCEFHPMFTRQDIRDFCKKHDIFFQAFSSLARFHNDVINNTTIVEMAKKYETTVPLILLAFALCQNVGIVPKSLSPERIAENISATKIKLSQVDINTLNSLNINQHYIRCTGWLVKT